ncbi:MAG: zf-HC2 domain-containing protein [Gemmatimonadales bacterium]|nr:zf-HC2 domain-containing protein [Gemmatimonadales bacterium]MBA3556528.1 zf-HC2 domain-containing protein [Gemmatimonadales bacterium]
MRHIPEDELHAYLDQGLSRTQCVEIESHLADCSSCRASRDRIAALRDRTTSLLARLAPPRQIPPAFESLRRRAAEEASQRRRRAHVAAWAASLVAAVGFGWTASSVIGTRALANPEVVQSPPPVPRAIAASAAEPGPDSAPARGAPAPTAPAVARPERVQRAPAQVVSRPARPSRSAKDSLRAAMLAVLDPAPAVELTQLDDSRSRNAGEFDGMWRTVSWDGARAEAGERLPHIDGLRVLKVQVQAGEPGKRSVMVVAQQLSSGQVIQTIEGPASDVSQLLARRAMSGVDSVVLRGDSLTRSAGGDHAMAMQLGDDRMLAITGALPSDSLRAMIRRLNAEMRSK